MTSLHAVPRCIWCGAPFDRKATGRPKLYCGPLCRQDAARYAERLPAWQAELAEAERAAASWRAIRKPVPVVIRNRIDNLERLIVHHGPRVP
ncbi:MAG TPA: hypothetical protein VIK13_13610 [Candidatus Limnocylindrales bacterium]|jgi:hypothetical protein